MPSTLSLRIRFSDSELRLEPLRFLLRLGRLLLFRLFLLLRGRRRALALRFLRRRAAFGGQLGGL